jgi:hypothetical protein
MSERDERSPFATIPERFAGAASELGRRLRFPVDSKAALAEQLGGTQASLTVGEETAAVSSWLMFMPAHCFPLASPDNFYEKIGELAAQRNPAPRSQVDPRRLRTIVEHFFAEQPAAEALAEAVSAVVGTTVEPDRIHDALDKIVSDERAGRAIADALARSYQAAAAPPEAAAGA